MTPHDLLASFHTLTDAPDGVKRLRELVLQLAARGQLVPQDPAEGRVVASGSPPAEDEAPFLLPETWVWLRLPEVAEYAVGKTPPTKDPRFWGNKDIPWVSIGDMPDGGVISTTKRTVTKEAATDVFRKALVPVGTLLMSFKLTIGKVAILGVPAYHNEAIISIVPNHKVERDYLIRVLPMMTVGGESKDAIMGATLNGQSLARVLVPTPPLAEQHRIVARVDELMGLLDRLEAARTARDEVRRAARDAALAALRDAEDTDAVEAAWGRIAGQMDALFAEPDDVGPLRQAVLGLAVRGRLVPQDAKEAPALHVVQAAMSRRLEANGRWTPLERPAANEVTFPPPRGWSWARFDDLCAIVSGVTKGRNLEGRELASFPYLRVANVQAGYLDLSVIKCIDLPLEELAGYRLRAGDVLLTEGGDWDKLGRSAVWSGEIAECIHQNHVFRARPLVAGVTSRWLSAFTNSADGRAYFQACSKQTTNLASINMRQLKNCPVPLPPEGEQHRIVAKVDALMAICDALEARLTTARDLHGQFAAAAVHHLDV